MKVKETIRNGWLDAIRTAIDAGTGAGKIKFYDGTQPATGAAVTTQNLLGTVLFQDPCAPAATGGVLTFATPLVDDDDADATGNATWARITDSADQFVCDCSVGLSGSGADIILNAVNIAEGGIVRVNSGTLTAGNA